MLIILCIALLLTAGRKYASVFSFLCVSVIVNFYTWINVKDCLYFSGCMDDQSFVTKNVHLGEDVTLTCSRRSNLSGLLFWIRVVAGNLPEVLGATYTFDQGTVNETPRITTKQEAGTFVLHIIQTQLNDTAFYYCEEVIELKTTKWNITFLRVKGK